MIVCLHAYACTPMSVPLKLPAFNSRCSDRILSRIGMRSTPHSALEANEFVLCSQVPRRGESPGKGRNKQIQKIALVAMSTWTGMTYWNVWRVQMLLARATIRIFYSESIMKVFPCIPNNFQCLLWSQKLFVASCPRASCSLRTTGLTLTIRTATDRRVPQPQITMAGL